MRERLRFIWFDFCLGMGWVAALLRRGAPHLQRSGEAGARTAGFVPGLPGVGVGGGGEFLSCLPHSSGDIILPHGIQGDEKCWDSTSPRQTLQLSAASWNKGKSYFWTKLLRMEISHHAQLLVMMESWSWLECPRPSWFLPSFNRFFWINYFKICFMALRQFSEMLINFLK